MAASVGQVALDIVLGKETFSSSIKNAVNECSKTLSNANATIGQKISSVGSCVSGIGATILPVSTAIGGLGLAVGKMSMNFEDAMAKVNTIANTSEVPLDTLKQQILNLSKQTGISASEIADNVYNAISAGQKTGDAVNFVSNATKLAKAGFTSSASSLDVLTTIMNAYGLEAGQVTNVSDMLIQTQNLGKTTVDELSSSMGKVIPTANSMGVGLDNLCSAYSIMTAKGIATAESTTYINSMLNELGDSGTTVGGILKDKTGMSFQELMASGKSLGDVLGIVQDYSNETGTAFNELWSSSEAGKAGISLLSDGVDSFNSRLGEMNNATGSTETAFKKMETNSYTLQKSMNEVKNVGIQLGDTLMQTLGPIIENVCGAVSRFTDWFSKLGEGPKTAIVSIGLFVAALGPVLIVVGKVISAVSTITSAVSTVVGFVSATVIPFITGTVIPALSGFFSFLLTNPIVLVIAAIIGAGVLLVKHWDQVKQVASNVWGKVCEIFNTAKDFIIGVEQSIVNGVTSFVSNVVSVVTNVFNTIKNGVVNFFTMIITSITSHIQYVLSFFTNTFASIQGIFNGLVTYFSGVFELIKNIILGPILLICDLVTLDFDKLRSDAINIFNNIKEALGNIVNGVKEVITNIIMTMVNFVIDNINYFKQTIINVFNVIKDTAINIFNALKEGISNAIRAVVDFIVNGFNNAKNGAINIANGIKDGAINAFNSMKTGISNTVSNIKNAIVNGFNAAIDWIKALPSQALGWGRDIIDNIVKGITGAVGKVKDAVKGVADGIRDFLHFSEPDVGPLSDFHTYMPDMMDLMSQGISKNTGSLMKTVDGLANEMSDALCITADTPDIKAVPKNTGAGTSSSTNSTTSRLEAILMQILQYLQTNKNNDNGDITIPVYIGNDSIDEIIITAQQRRALRSGGMS